MSFMIVPIIILTIISCIVAIEFIIKDNPVGVPFIIITVVGVMWSSISISEPRQTIFDEIVPVKTLDVVESNSKTKKYSYQIVEYNIEGDKYTHRTYNRIIYPEGQKFRVRVYKDGWYGGMYWFFDHKVEPYYEALEPEKENLEVKNESI